MYLDGNYNYNGCDIIISPTLSNTDTPISNIKTGLYVYPNPIHSTVTIKGALNSTLNLYDINGRKIRSQVITNERQILDLSQLNTGIYYVKVKNKKTNTVLKLVKN